MTEESNDTKTCPFCAETIKAAAIVCKHCGRDLVVQAPHAKPIFDGLPDAHHPTPTKRAFSWGTAALVLLVAVPIIALGSVYIRNKVIGAAGWLKDDTEKLLRARMRDPDSLVIRDHYFVRNQTPGVEGMVTICGIVDGKNGFGAFAGGTRFVAYAFTGANSYTGPREVFMEDPRQQSDAHALKRLSAFESVYWNGHCVDATHPAIEP